MIDVLSLGVKNDGSEDISSIVNAATERDTLFFPGGIYKLSQPLYLKNSIRGEGYSRSVNRLNGHTWFISEIDNDDSSVGMINIEGDKAVDIENISLNCCSQECGVRVVPCCQKNMILIDKVGIFNVKGYGVYVEGSGSRTMFMQNMTIWGSKEYPIPGVGIQIDNADNRFSNIEIIACRVGMCLNKNFNYGSNLHIWTGPLAFKDNGSWWRGTRSLVLDRGAMFNVTNFYPDTSFYVIESKTAGCSCHIANIFYWEDGSTGGSPDFDGVFFKGAPGAVFQVCGGEIYMPGQSEKNGRLESVYTPGNSISGVMLKTNAEICAENLCRLVLDDTMPDYMIEYADPGWCKVAELVAAQPTGAIEAQIICENGACYDMKCFQKTNGSPETRFTGTNPLCEDVPPLAVRQKNDSVYEIFFQKKSDGPETFRFVTRVMQSKFRPLHFGVLKNLDKSSPCFELLREL